MPKVSRGDYRTYGDDRAGMGGLRTTNTQRMHDLFADSRLSQLERSSPSQIAAGIAGSEQFYASHPLGQLLDSLSQSRTLRNWMPQQMHRAYQVGTRGERGATSGDGTALFNALRKMANPDFGSRLDRWADTDTARAAATTPSFVPADMPQSRGQLDVSLPQTPQGSAMHPLDAARQLGQQGAGLRSSPLNQQYNTLIQGWQGATPRANQQAIAQRMALPGRAPAPQPQQPQQAPWEPRLAQLAPDNPADAARANQLDAVLLGHDMRFGPKSPASMFRQRVQQQPGMMGGVVHPMMPSFGGAAPRPAPQNNPEASIPTQQAIDEWNANEGKARGRFMEMTPLGISASGNAYQSNPGQYAMGLNGLMGRMNKGPAVSFDKDGNVVDMSGNPMTVDMMRQMSGQARSQLENQKIGGLRTNARIRNAVTDAQRGRPGALVAANADGLLPGNVLNALFPQPAPFIQVGPDGRGGGGNAGPMPVAANDPMERVKMIAPFLEGLPPEMRMQAMMSMIGDAAQRNPINVRQHLQNIQGLRGRASRAERAVTTPQAGDMNEVPAGMDPNAAFAAVRAAHPDWHPNRVKAAVAAQYQDYLPPSDQHPIFGGLGQRVNPATGQTERTAINPMGWMDAIGSLFSDGWGGAAAPGPKRKMSVRPLPGVPFQQPQ